MTLAEEAKRLAAECRREAEAAMSESWRLPGGSEYMQEYASRMSHVANVLEALASGRPLDSTWGFLPQTDLQDYHRMLDEAVASLARRAVQQVYD